MKSSYLLIALLALFQLHAQVGIKTTAPTADFDINGTLRIRSTSVSTDDTEAQNNILVTDALGNVHRTTSKKIIESQLKTLVKGAFVSSSDVSLTLSSGTKKIPFDYEEFDTNNEFDITTSTFTAKQDGIYQISVQIKATSSIGIATDFGVAILKNGTIINRNTYANVGVALVNVTPPVRNLQTLVSLSTGDTLNFNVVSSLVSLGVIGSKEDCFFSIHQVR